MNADAPDGTDAACEDGEVVDLLAWKIKKNGEEIAAVMALNKEIAIKLAEAADRGAKPSPSPRPAPRRGNLVLLRDTDEPPQK